MLLSIFERISIVRAKMLRNQETSAFTARMVLRLSRVSIWCVQNLSGKWRTSMLSQVEMVEMSSLIVHLQEPK